MNHSNQPTSSFQENETFLSCPCASKEELEKQYKRNYEEKAKAEELYLLILCELEKAIIECDLDRFKKLSSLIDCINEIEDQKTLNDFYSNSNNPLRSTNFVILACKHNTVKILEYLFENSDKFINNLSIGIKRTVILPQEEDEEGHNAFYYAICSGNIDLLDTLCNKWPVDNFTVCLEELDKIISRAYEDLKLKNVPLSEEIGFFVESKLIDLRFFCGNAQSTKTNLSNIKERIGLVLENISLLKEEYLNSKEVDGKFLFIARFIAQNIHMLKQQLKSTYNRLPWEEMEFFLVCFVSFYKKPQEINLFYYNTLNKGKILNHLANFAKRLEDEKCCLENMDLDKLAKLPKLQREKVVVNIISNYPEFEDFYDGYQQIRDICSLEKIYDCVKLVSSANPEKKEGQLVVMRVLQVIGEFLKNTLESPKLSNKTSDLLLLSFPKYARKVIMDLRDSLSHANSLFKRTEIEEYTNSNFFTNIQNDTKKVGDVVTDLLYSYRIKRIRLLLKIIVDSDNSDKVKEISEILSNVDVDKMLNNNMLSENFIMMEQKKLETLVKELNDAVTEKTFYEKHLFEKINSIFNHFHISTKIKSETIQGDYTSGFISLMFSGIPLSGNRIENNVIRNIKLLAKRTLQKIAPETESHRLRVKSHRDIADLSLRIYCSVGLRMQYDNNLTRLIFKILYIIEVETGDIKWINEFKEKLNKKGSDILVYKEDKSDNGSRKNCNEQFTLKLSELKNVLRTNKLCDKSIKNLHHYKSDKKLQAVVEMHVLDIMSILENLKILGNNQLFLDHNSPILTGKCLRDHIAHDNAVVHLLLSDPSIAVILNAKMLVSENVLENKRKLGKLVKDDPLSLKDKYSQSLIIVSNQERMFSAIEEGNLEELKCCLRKGANINGKSISSWTSLHFAAKGPSLEIIKFIIDQNIDINAKDVNGQTPFHVAAAYGKKHFLELFKRKAGLLVDDKDNRGKTPLHYASQNGHKDAVEILINSKANTSIIDFASMSPLNYAIINNHVDVAKILLNKEVHVDMIEVVGDTPLHIAAGNGHLEIVNFLLEKGANVNARNDHEGIPLHAAALNGHLEVLSTLILKGADIDSTDIYYGVTPLHWAVENGHEEIVNILLKEKAKVDVGKKPYNATPLHYAAKHGHEEIVEALLKSNANACAATVDGITPLHLAVHSGHLNIVAALLECKVDIFIKDKVNNSILHCAAENGNKMVAELLISYGAGVNVWNNDNLTPLHLAAEKSHRDITYLLLTNKADVKAQDIDGNTPLHKAAIYGSKDVIDHLIKNEADVNARNNKGMTPLYIAALKGHKYIVAYLLKYKAEVNAKTNDGLIPLHGAVMGGHKYIIELLIEKGAYVNPTNITDFPPLHMAVEVGQREIVEILIANGANVNIQKKTSLLCDMAPIRFNLTPLLSAVKCNNKEIVQILIEKGAKVDAGGGGALQLATFAGYRDIVEILLKNHADIKIKGANDETPLHIAAQRGDVKIVNTLITRKADVDALTINGETPLHFAASGDHVGVVEVLISKRADVNVKSNKGATPLNIAASNGFINVVKVLLDNEVSVTVKDNKNRTPLELAVANGHLQVVKMLLEYKKIDMNTKGNDDQTLLHIASQKSDLEMVKYLVEEGSNINTKNSLFLKPIQIAALEGHKDTVEFFLDKGSIINEPDAYNRTLLHLAAVKGQCNFVKILIARGADVNFKGAYDITPMHIAATFDFKNVIELLLENRAVYNIRNEFDKKPVEMASDQSVISLLSLTEKLFEAVKHKNCSDVEKYIKLGAFVNAKSDAGGMPIHFAAWKGHEQIVNILLQYKADPNVICKTGLSPLHYATKFSHLKIVKALLSKGAIYNAVSDNGKTPSDFSVDSNITKLFQSLREYFEKIENGDCNVINELNRINDIDTIKAIMGACNRENKSLIVAAMKSNFSKVEELKQISQPDISTQVNEGKICMRESKYQEAFDMFESAFIKRKEMLGPNNPGTLDIQFSMANARYKQGMYQEALNMFETIFKIQERILGLDDEGTLITRSMIALMLHQLGKDEDAYNICQEVFQKQKELHGSNHQYTLMTQLNMALVLDAWGKYEEAYNIYSEFCEITEREPFEPGSNNVFIRNGIAMILTNQGKYEKALKIFEEVLEERKLLYPLDDPITLRTMGNIAFILFKQRKPNNAFKAYQEVLDKQKDKLGEDHPDTLITEYHLGTVFFAQSRVNSALRIYSKVFDPLKAVLGPNHPLVLDISAKMKMINEHLNS